MAMKQIGEESEMGGEGRGYSKASTDPVFELELGAGGRFGPTVGRGGLAGWRDDSTCDG